MTYLSNGKKDSLFQTFCGTIRIFIKPLDRILMNHFIKKEVRVFGLFKNRKILMSDNVSLKNAAKYIAGDQRDKGEEISLNFKKGREK